MKGNIKDFSSSFYLIFLIEGLVPTEKLDPAGYAVPEGHTYVFRLYLLIACMVMTEGTYYSIKRIIVTFINELKGKIIFFVP